jgi:hypothetical protein
VPTPLGRRGSATRMHRNFALSISWCGASQLPAENIAQRLGPAESSLGRHSSGAGPVRRDQRATEEILPLVGSNCRRSGCARLKTEAVAEHASADRKTSQFWHGRWAGWSGSS